MPVDTESSRRTAQLDEARLAYPAQWSRIISDWRGEGPDAAWMMYSANYLLRTAGLRWAVDPLLLSSRIGGFSMPHAAEDLRSLDWIVLTHAHLDHLDLPLLARLADQPIRWVIPGHLLPLVCAQVNIPTDRMVVPLNGVPISLGPVTLYAFDGLHFDRGHGVPATGYLAEFNQTQWLFPGDTRCYVRSALPNFGPLDGVFAHLWLGRGGALEPHPALLEPFCQFFSDLNPTRLVVTHLEEWRREDPDRWGAAHYRQVAACLVKLNPKMQVRQAMTGDRVDF
jgi:hypothetical protein